MPSKTAEKKMSINRTNGRIMRIKMHNFMTYDNLEVRPGPALNIIIGLNGSGKSTIMSAICLGLAGKPQHTGRSVHLADFIKVGCINADIEIELEDVKSSNTVIGRTIHKDKSTWTINGSSASYNEVSAIVKKYNIDTSNLCQFLPQEKVAEFSKMDKKQRLENMIQTIGDPNLVRLFEELKGKKSELESLQTNIEKTEKDKNSEIEKNERLMPEMSKLSLRLVLEDQLKLCKYNLRLKEYEIFRERCKDLKKKSRELREKVQNSEMELSTVKSDYDALQEETNKRRDKVNSLRNENVAVSDNISNLVTALKNLDEEAESGKVYYKSRIEEKKNQKAKLESLQHQLESLEVQYQYAKNEMQGFEEKFQRNTREYNEIRKKMSSLDSQMEQIKIEMVYLDNFTTRYMEERKSITNLEAKKLSSLNARCRDSFQAVQWLKDHQDAFKSPICLPPLVSICMSADSDRKYIENHVGMRDLLAFVCEHKDDVMRLTTILKDQKKLNVNIALAPNESMSHFQSPMVTTEKRRLGVRGFLSGIFVAPDPVMRYLCSIYQLHLIPIINLQGNYNMDIINTHYSRYFTQDEKISSRRSKYGDKRPSVRKEMITCRNILPNVADKTERFQQLECQIQVIDSKLSVLKSQYEQHESNKKDLDRDLERVRLEKTHLTELHRKLGSAKIKFQQKKDAFEKKQNDLIDEDEEKSKLSEKMRTCNIRRIQLYMEQDGQLKVVIAAKSLSAKNLIVLQLLKKEMYTSKRILQEKEQLLRSLKEKLDETANELKKNFSEGEKLVVEFQSLDPTILVAIQNVSGPERTLEEVKEQIASLEAQLELNGEENQNVKVEFKRRENTIKNAEETIKRLKEEHSQVETEIQTTKALWLPPLLRHIESVNKKFTEYYKILSCAGDICLDTAEDSDDFQKYGLQIRVKYRVDEDLQELSQSHHSGGECSVAAIIFILSLQELTEVPFRCIDEINQGMDSINERKMYQLVAKVARTGSCTQYFLLTPKLLMDLSYHRDIKVHAIYNSPKIAIDNTVLQDHLTTAKRNSSSSSKRSSVYQPNLS